MLKEKTDDLADGFRIGHYCINSKIGAGAMGEVYLAQDTKLDRKVALKILLPEFAEDADRMSRFVREAKSVSALNHPNIITIHEIGESAGTHFIATEYIDGKTLSKYSKSISLTFKSALDIAIQIASALDEAHSAGIVHRDIKPDNVMVRGNGLVKVLDFGIAKLSTPSKSAELAAKELKSDTNPGMIIGTANYMSPEQARGKTVDARSDIFSFGVVLYELLSGKLPFEGESPSDVIAAVLKSDPPPLVTLLPEIPGELDRIIKKTLRKDRGERYQTAENLLMDLTNLRQELEFQNKFGGTSSNDGLIRSSDKFQTQESPGAKTLIFGSPTSGQTILGDGDRKIITSSSAEYIAHNVSKHKYVLFGALGFVVAALAAIGYLTSFRATPINSIAVLPFFNVGGDQKDAYLSDGLSENLINTLSRLPQLKVIARSSSFKFSGENIDIQDAAKKLGVGAIVTGRIVRRGDDLQINVELIDAADNTRIWGDIYNRRVSGALSVSEEIAHSVSEKLQLKLSGAQERQIAKQITKNPQAYPFYMNGILYRRKNGAENIRKAIEYQNQAIAVDPNFTLAYTELSINFAVLVEIAALSPKEGMPQARAAAQKALALDETLAEAHYTMARVKDFEFDWTGAESAFEQAIELNPNLAGAHTLYAEYLSRSGRFDEALREVKMAQELDPLRTGLIGNEGTILYHARRYNEAIAKKQIHVSLASENPFAHMELANAYVQVGKYEEAIFSYQTSIKLEETPTALIYLGRVYALSGKTIEAAAILDKLKTTEKYVSPTELAILDAALGDEEEAFASLEKAFTERDFQLAFIKVEPAYDPLRGDPRFQELLRKVGFPP